VKPFEAQSYYELLEVSVSATTAEIESAFVRLSRLYGDDQMSLYGLVEPQRAKELKERLDEARQVLTSDALRAEYDKRIGLPPRAAPQPDVAGQLGFSGLLPSPPSRNVTTHVAAPTQGASSSSEPPRHDEAPVSTAAPPRLEVAPQSLSPAPAPAASSPAVRLAAPAPAPEPPAPPSPTALAVSSAAPKEEPAAADSKPKPVEIPDGAVFNGALLKRVREARGLTLQVLSDRTRIGVRHLENLEADRYPQLPAAVYLRGMLMSLSRELGIDGLKVSKSYLSLVEQAKG
jgi:Helix-turn-helix domain